MAKFDDQVAIMGDWMPPSPSPKTLFLSTMSDDVGLKGNTEANGENRSGALVMPEEQIVSKNVDEKERMQAEARVAVDQVIKAPEGRVPSRGGLLERVAARSGFNALRLNTEGMRSTDISQKTEARSPYLTISPGLSPTTLLDSPVFLSNSLVLPSPTTGKFQFVSSDNNRNSTLATEDPDKRKDNYFEDINNSSFAFKPVVESGHHIFPIEQSQAISFTLAQPSFPTNEFSIQSENFILPQNIPTKLASQTGTALKFQTDLSRCSSEKDYGANNMSSEPKVFDTVGDSEHSLLLDDQKEDDVDQRGGGDTNLGGAPSEDGYNWRKYGQKQVKGSEYPRSYYKCTHPNCPVKKKVERSHEGHVTEIIYKGTHCHHKPPPKRRSALGSSNVLTDTQLDVSEQDGTGAEGNLFWTTMQKVTATGVPDWSQENLGGTSSAALDTEYCNASASLQAQTGAQFEAGDALDESSAFSNDEDEEDRRTHGSVSLGYDGEEYESESKRRKIDAYTTEMSGATRAIREPRVVVQTTSEVDILDDGFRWRKYGQKVVKGNPNPRSYYKCTSAGCSVRKHVERASHDLKSVITTYEGKHNHDVPAPRNSSHINSSISNTLPAQASVLQSHLHRPEPLQVHNSMAGFDGSSALGSFCPPGRLQLGPTHGFGFGMNQPGLLNWAMAGLNPNQGKLPIMPPYHPYLGQSRPINEMGFMLPKEPKVESISEPGLNVPNGRLPLGPRM